MSDPRLAEWLELSRRLLDASSEERLALLDSTHARRAELVRSLGTLPPERVSSELASELEDAEARLQSAAMDAREHVAGELGSLQRVRDAARGYRPARANRPAFVSTSR